MTDTAPANPRTYLDPAAIARLKNLGLAARLVVEGLFAGRHRSPHKGFSIEFAEHRPYTPGVDPRHLDWKLLARRDRLYVKQYEEQTNLRACLVLDTSASMGYRHSGPMTKLQYACYCAASLAYLMQHQQDAAGLTTFNDKIIRHVPPRQGRSHLHALLDELDRLQPAGETDLAAALHALAQTIKRRALVVVLSDLFTAGDTKKILDAIAHLRHHKHEVIVMQVLDPAEREFPFQTATEIEDLETHQVVAADGELFRREYLRRLGDFLDTVRRSCARHDVEHVLADTSQPFDLFLGTYLSRRGHGELAPPSAAAPT
jgi:uncharacterized protein (DUF58 family)